MSNEEPEQVAVESRELVGAEKDGSSSDEAPNIVVFSDGTWNQGGAANPTNVWRAFQVTSKENQIKFHDNGVGSEGNRITRLIGGAFGHGISRNLRELIAFVIQSYQPGSRIFLFGFSRGAFTVRVLANILCMYGIPKKDGGEKGKKLETTEQVEEVAAEMLRSYKREKSRLFALESMSSDAKREAYCKKHKSNIDKFHEDYDCYLNNAAEDAGDSEHLIHFLGCWDTVDALGVPFEPVKRVAKFYFPLSIRKSNTRPHEKIATVCHALSLDDERRAFHPLCFEDPDDAAPSQTVYQTWFPGNHCHVGGGYQRDQMAMVPLAWMLEHATTAGLAVNQAQLEDMLSTGFTHGQLPNSRGGMNFFYGYHPRRIDDFQEFGPWSIHVSAVERLGEQIQFYLPTGIVVSREKVKKKTLRRVPATHPNDGIATDLPSEGEDQGDTRGEVTIYIDGGGGNLAYTWPEQLPIPEKVYLEDERPKESECATLDYSACAKRLHEINETHIWVGQVLWYFCLALAVVLLSVGWAFSLGPQIYLMPSNPVTSVFFSLEELAVHTLALFLPTIVTEHVLGGFLRLSGFLTYWSLTALVILFLCRRNRRLIEREAFGAWDKTPIAKIKNRSGNKEYKKKTFESSRIGKLADQFLLFCAKLAVWGNPTMRGLSTKLQRFAFWFFKRRVISIAVPSVLGAAIVFGCCVYLTHSAAYKAIASARHNSSETLQITKFPKVIAEGGEPRIFDTRKPAFNTGIRVEKGGLYKVTVTVTDKLGAEFNPDADSWDDWGIPAGPNGYDEPSEESFVHSFRKYPDLPLFKVLGKIETTGQEVFEIGREGTFFADADGVLILFVNDVIGFYAINNHGWATIAVQRLDHDH